MTDDLSADVLAAALPRRQVRAYPALLSTEADALSWARRGAPHGAVVVADYQASPRGRGGLPWKVHPGQDLGFSLILRSPLPAEREGWLYTVAVCGLADVLGAGTTIAWPDEIRRPDTGAEDAVVGAVGVHAEFGPAGVDWAVVNILVPGVGQPRGPVLGRLVGVIEARLASPAVEVLGDYVTRCSTIGTRVRARLIPLGPSGREVIGRAVDALADGALVIATDEGNRVAVRPQHVGVLEHV